MANTYNHFNFKYQGEKYYVHASTTLKSITLFKEVNTGTKFGMQKIIVLSEDYDTLHEMEKDLDDLWDFIRSRKEIRVRG